MKLIENNLLGFIMGTLIGVLIVVMFGECQAEEKEPCPLECEVYVECLPCDMVKDKDGTMKGHGGWCYVNK